MINDIKLSKAQRNKKIQRRRQLVKGTWTPEKNTVRRLEKKFGYDYENVDDSQLLQRMRSQFRMKAAEYCGGKTFNKKQTRFDKMKKKEELGFEMEMNPVLTCLRRVDRILNRHVLGGALLKMKKY